MFGRFTELDYKLSTNDFKQLLEGLADLPDDIILLMFEFFPVEYIRTFFLYWQKTRPLVISNYYSKELHCIFSPLKKERHICLDANAIDSIYDLYFKFEIDEFFHYNPDIIPNKLVFITGSDFYSLFEIIQKYETRILMCQNLEILMDDCQFALTDFQYILKTFNNISRLRLGQFNLENVNMIMNLEFPRLKNLKTIQYLAHNVVDWSTYRFPPNLTSLDCSWFEQTDILTLPMPPNLTELYLNHSNINFTVFDILFYRLPANLKILMATYNNIDLFKCNYFPNSIEKLDLLFNGLEYILVADMSPTIWPLNLKELNLEGNSLTDESFYELENKIWPQSLKVVNLSGNEISDFSILNDLPDTVEELNLLNNEIEFIADGDKIEPIKFPKNLTILYLFGCPNLVVSLQNDESIQGKIIFPDNLKELYLARCGISTLKFFKFPKSLELLELPENRITTLDSYEFDWEKLINLRKIVLGHNSIKSIDTWRFPPNLIELDLYSNSLTRLSKRTPFFNRDHRPVSKVKIFNFAMNIIQSIEGIEISGNNVELSLAGNYLPTTFHISSELLKLYRLDISENKIVDITYDEAKEPQPLQYFLLYKLNHPFERLLSQEDANVIYDKLEKAIGHKIFRRIRSLYDINLKRGPISYDGFY